MIYNEIFQNDLNFFNENLLETPISFQELEILSRKNSIHESALALLSTNISSGFTASNDIFKFEDLINAVNNFVIFGNAFLVIERNKLKKITGLKSIPVLFSRYTLDLKYLYCSVLKKKKIPIKDIVHIKSETGLHSPYGIPHYISAIRDIKIIDKAKEIRESFYERAPNPTGIIVKLEDIGKNSLPSNSLAEAFKDTRTSKRGSLICLTIKTNGPPGTKIDDILKFIPDGGMLFQKDEYNAMIEISERSILSAHRIPAELLGIFKGHTPSNIDKIKHFLYESSIYPVQELFKRTIESYIPITINFKKLFIEEKK